MLDVICFAPSCTSLFLFHACLKVLSSRTLVGVPVSLPVYLKSIYLKSILYSGSHKTTEQFGVEPEDLNVSSPAWGQNRVNSGGTRLLRALSSLLCTSSPGSLFQCLTVLMVKDFSYIQLKCIILIYYLCRNILVFTYSILCLLLCFGR